MRKWAWMLSFNSNDYWREMHFLHRMRATMCKVFLGIPIQSIFELNTKFCVEFKKRQSQKSLNTWILWFIIWFEGNFFCKRSHWYQFIAAITCNLHKLKMTITKSNFRFLLDERKFGSFFIGNTRAINPTTKDELMLIHIYIMFLYFVYLNNPMRNTRSMHSMSKIL